MAFYMTQYGEISPGGKITWTWKKRWRRRRFMKAYKIIRNESERHKKAGHDVDFRAVNEAYLIMHCYKCPELLP